MTPRSEIPGPTWRQPGQPDLTDRRTFVVCRCGVDMEFDWPAGRESVRCFGCGARFDRPPQFPQEAAGKWEPEAVGRVARLGRFTRKHVWVFVLSLVAAGLLGVGVGLLLAGR